MISYSCFKKKFLCMFAVLICLFNVSVFADQTSIDQGKYMVRLLGCEGCHTHGYLKNLGLKKGGEPEPLAGSRVGLAFRLMANQIWPAIVFPSNLTPDEETGIGGWSQEEIVDVLTTGVDRHGKVLWPVMPWSTLAELKQEDAKAIADYLMSLDPIYHRVPDNVPAGEPSDEEYVLFMMADDSEDR